MITTISLVSIHLHIVTLFVLFSCIENFKRFTLMWFTVTLQCFIECSQHAVHCIPGTCNWEFVPSDDSQPPPLATISSLFLSLIFKDSTCKCKCKCNHTVFICLSLFDFISLNIMPSRFKKQQDFCVSMCQVSYTHFHQWTQIISIFQSHA